MKWMRHAPEEAVTEDWATTWGSAKLLFSLSETYERTRDPADAQQARKILLALKRIARWDGAKAFYPGGRTPWRGGQWLKRGWARTHYHNRPQEGKRRQVAALQVNLTDQTRPVRLIPVPRIDVPITLTHYHPTSTMHAKHGSITYAIVVFLAGTVTASFPGLSRRR